MKYPLIGALLLLACPAKKDEPRYSVGPISIAVPPGFVDDMERAQKLKGDGKVETENRVWVNKLAKMQVALSLSRLSHQPEWDKVSTTVLLTELVLQELAAGEKSGLKTVDSERKWVGEALHYTVEGDLAGKLATSSHTALWLDDKGDCWHASAVCTAQPADRSKCKELMKTVQLAIDAGTPAPAPAAPK